MKKYFLLCLLVMVFCTTACTHYKGGDPDLWGLWKLESITVDGNIDPDYNSNYFFAFQGPIILIQEVDDEFHESINHYGTWTLDRDAATLTLTFSYSNDETPPGEGMYAPPTAIFIYGPDTVLEVIELNDKTMTLRHTASSTTIVYKLRRWN